MDRNVISFARGARILSMLVTLSGSMISARAQAPAGSYRPSTVPGEYMVTPFGYFHPTCVKRLMEGDVLQRDEGTIHHADGSVDSMPACRYPRYSRDGAVVKDTDDGLSNPVSTSANPSTYVEYYGASPTTSLSQLSATWAVPSPPASVSDGQTVYFFPGIEQTPNINTIVQPVLGWNADFPNAWGIASWNCCVSGVTSESTPKRVNAGDTISGQISSTCSAGTLTCATWNISTQDSTSGVNTSLQSSGQGQTFNFAIAGALEVYNLAQCIDLPSTYGVTFSSLKAYDYNGNLISNPQWRLIGESSSLVAQCGYSGNAGSGTVTLAFDPCD